jgi:hypothetical protein
LQHDLKKSCPGPYELFWEPHHYSDICYPLIGSARYGFYNLGDVFIHFENSRDQTFWMLKYS